MIGVCYGLQIHGTTNNFINFIGFLRQTRTQVFDNR